MKSQLVASRVDVKDCSIFYLQSGLKSNSTPILFIHGWGISTEPYQEILELLARQHSLVAPDLPSFAQSSYRKLILDQDGYARFLISFLDALDVQKVHLVGYSLGGGVAIALSTLAPYRIKSLVLVDSTGIPCGSILDIGRRRAIEMSIQLFSPRLRLKLVDIPLVFSYNLLFNTGNIIQALLLALWADLKDRLPRIQAPCLLLWSEKDLITPLTVAEEMATLIPDSRLTIVEEGCHEWGLWYPEKLTSIVLNFIHQIEIES